MNKFKVGDRLIFHPESYEYMTDFYVGSWDVPEAEVPKMVWEVRDLDGEDVVVTLVSEPPSQTIFEEIERYNFVQYWNSNHFTPAVVPYQLPEDLFEI